MSDLNDSQTNITVTTTDLQKVSVISGAFGAVAGIIASVAVAAFFAGEQWGIWKDIREKHDANLLVNLEPMAPDLTGFATKEDIEGSVATIMLEFERYTSLTHLGNIDPIPRSEFTSLLAGYATLSDVPNVNGAIMAFARGHPCPPEADKITDLHLLLRNTYKPILEVTEELGLDDSTHDGGDNWDGHRFYGCYFK